MTILLILVMCVPIPPGATVEIWNGREIVSRPAEIVAGRIELTLEVYTDQICIGIYDYFDCAEPISLDVYLAHVGLEKTPSQIATRAVKSACVYCEADCMTCPLYRILEETR